MDLIFTLAIALAIIILVMLFFTFVPVGLWVTAFFSGVKIGITTLIGMRLRRVVPSRIVNPLIKATKAGLSIEVDKLEDRKSTRLNSSHVRISYAVFCLKKKKKKKK